MPLWLKAASKWGSILALIALLITLVKSLIALVGTIMFAVKAAIVLAFIVLFLGVAIAVFRSINKNKKQTSEN